ncbi:MAG TPA: MarR family winged helix-turn-helix transcriptional regulator [Pseudonocardiaceae bacterium]
MPPPARPPLGLKLARTAKAVSGAFDDALSAAGGSLPIWLILISLKTQQLGNQRELAEAIGIQGATLTHHLNAMEANGLLTRRRHPDNRRIHVVELTDEGESMFHRLRTAAVAFDQRLRAGLSDDDLATLEHLLNHLHNNVTVEHHPAPNGGAGQPLERHSELNGGAG